MPAKKKTVIVDGEVMDADDPRYLEYIGARRASAAEPTASRGGAAGAGPSTSAGAPAQTGPGFSLSAPPFRLLPSPPGGGIMKTEAEVFGKRVPVVALIAVALLALQFGWRAAAGAGLFLFLYLANSGGGPAPPRPAPGARPGQAQGGGGFGFADVLNNLGLGNAATMPPGSSAGGQQQQGQPRQQAGSTQGRTRHTDSGSGGAFTGRGHKLTD